MYPMNSENLGRLVLKERQKKGLKQSELAEKLNISPQFLGRIEKELVPIPEPVLLKIVKELKVDKPGLKLSFKKSYDQFVDNLFLKANKKRARGKKG